MLSTNRQTDATDIRGHLKTRRSNIEIRHKERARGSGRGRDIATERQRQSGTIKPTTELERKGERREY